MGVVEKTRASPNHIAVSRRCSSVNRLSNPITSYQFILSSVMVLPGIPCLSSYNVYVPMTVSVGFYNEDDDRLVSETGNYHMQNLCTEFVGFHIHKPLRSLPKP